MRLPHPLSASILRISFGLWYKHEGAECMRRHRPYGTDWRVRWLSLILISESGSSAQGFSRATPAWLSVKNRGSKKRGGHPNGKRDRWACAGGSFEKRRAREPSRKNLRLHSMRSIIDPCLRRAGHCQPERIFPAVRSQKKWLRFSQDSPAQSSKKRKRMKKVRSRQNPALGGVLCT